MATTDPYYILYHGDENWAPGLKFYSAGADTASAGPIEAVATAVKDMIHEAWEVIGWESFNAANIKTGEAVLGYGGVWVGDPMVVKWCYTVTLLDVQIGGHPSIKYMRGLSESMFNLGEPVTGLLDAIDTLGGVLRNEGFTNGSGAEISGAKFGTASKRGKIRRRMQL